jgi:hypothetical protein
MIKKLILAAMLIATFGIGSVAYAQGGPPLPVPPKRSGTLAAFDFHEECGARGITPRPDMPLSANTIALRS